MELKKEAYIHESKDIVVLRPIYKEGNSMKEDVKLTDSNFVELTDSDFELFKSHCESWLGFFGLFGWRVYYFFEECDGAYAEVRCDIIGRVASITLNKKVAKRDFDQHSLDRTAFHEVCEILFARVKSINNARYVADDEMEEEIHHLIRTLENVVYLREEFDGFKK